MSALGYLRSHVVWVTCNLLSLAFVGAFLPMLGVERDPTLLMVLVLAGFAVVPGVHGYLRERRLMRQLGHTAAQTDEALEMGLLVEGPGYPEGDLAAQAVYAVAREGQRRTSDALAQAQRYRQYVESWVHEIKTPLAAIRLFLANQRDPSLHPLRLEVDRVEGYVEQALYYARSSSVERDYVIREQSLAHVVKEAVRSRSSELIGAHVSVDLAGLEGVPPVPCDEKWMVFVVGQIIDNGVHYRCDPVVDGRTPRITFSARVEGVDSAHGRVTLDIEDNGCGISEADLGRVFEHGFTGDNGRVHRRSTGMGLYLVRTLCDRMGLAVGIDSELGQWTCVSIVFPAWSSLPEGAAQP